MVRHPQQLPQLDAVRVRFDFLGLLGQIFNAALKENRLALGVLRSGGRLVLEARVRVGDRRELDVFVDGACAGEVLALQFDLDAGAGAGLASCGEQFVELGRFFIADDVGAVLRGVHFEDHLVRDLARAGLGEDAHRLAGGDQAVHAGSGDADALLASAHLEAVELRAVEQAPEDVLDLLADDARAVVLHDDDVAVFGDLGLVDDLDGDVGQDPGFLAGVEGVIDGFLDGRQQGLARVIEAEEVAVLGEELGDGDVTLLGGHRLGVGGLA